MARYLGLGHDIYSYQSWEGICGNDKGLSGLSAQSHSKIEQLGTLQWKQGWRHASDDTAIVDTS